MNAKQLRSSILQAAVQGKLVDQNPHDEPASLLVERIVEEKNRLIKEKKIKKPKSTSRIFRKEGKFYESVNGKEAVCIDDKLPFEIPESWEWVRLGDVGIWGAGATPAKTNASFYEKGSIPWLLTGDLNDGYITKIPNRITELALRDTSVKLNPIGSILIAMYGATIGKLGILSIEATTNQACCACNVFNNVSNKFLFYYLMSMRNYFRKKSEGGAQPNISKEKIIVTPFPIPPIAEQNRIVRKIEELDPFIQEYDSKEQSLRQLQQAFPQQLKKSILQAGIQGKLVPQDKNDEAASVLLDQIAKVKAQLIKEKKLKKPKSTSRIFRKEGKFYESINGSEAVCIDDELPFDIPENWEWARLGEVGHFSSGLTPKRELLKSHGKIPYFKVSDMNTIGNEVFMIKACSFVSDIYKGKTFSSGTIIFPKNGGAIYTNKKRILSNRSVVDLNTGTYSRYDIMDLNYTFIFFKYINFKKFTKGTALPTIDQQLINNIFFPIPPLNEQKRIVKEIEMLLEKIEKLP